jgi:hypothetical protein
MTTQADRALAGGINGRDLLAGHANSRGSTLGT